MSEWELQPWRAESFKFSADLRLEARVRDVIGLYPNRRTRPSCYASMRNPKPRRWNAPRGCCFSAAGRVVGPVPSLMPVRGR